MTTMGGYGYLAAASAVAALVFGALATVFVRRLLQRPSTPAAEAIGGVGALLAKVREHGPMSQDEADAAARIIADRSAPLAYCVPAALFAVGSLYVFGKLEQLHGATPSWATFIGVLPMLGALNMTGQLHRIGRLKRALDSTPVGIGNKSGTRSVDSSDS